MPIISAQGDPSLKRNVVTWPLSHIYRCRGQIFTQRVRRRNIFSEYSEYYWLIKTVSQRYFLNCQSNLDNGNLVRVMLSIIRKYIKCNKLYIFFVLRMIISVRVSNIKFY